MYQTGCNAYRQSAGNTVEDNRVVLLKLYDGSLKFLAHARRGIMEQSPRIRGENISKAMAVINELNCALDMEKGGQLAAQLDSLYQYVIDQLTTVNMKNDLQALDQAERILVTLKEGFDGAYQQMKRGGSAPQVMEETKPVPVQEGIRFAV
jgi:flagellar secretion chaperone FliS